MIRTQIQFPDPPYQRLKNIAGQQDWSLSEVMPKAAEHFVTRSPEDPQSCAVWHFPTLDCGGDFLTDPASLRPEADTMLQRSGSWSSPPIPISSSTPRIPIHPTTPPPNGSLRIRSPVRVRRHLTEFVPGDYPMQGASTPAKVRRPGTKKMPAGVGKARAGSRIGIR